MADGSRFLDFGSELVVDLFAGGGGASHGISRAYREPDVAVNHNPVAIAVHTINHPYTDHHIEDVFDVDPIHATKGQPVGLLWASPDCKHFSKAKGGKPRDKKIRGLAWVVTKWAAAVKPRVICLENVEEFTTWGPLLDDGKPCPDRKGQTFEQWKLQLVELGYKVEHRELIAADYGAPTIRKRLYVIARRDGRPIVWPEPTHSKHGTANKWIGADTCIDWSIPSQSIFDRKKPLSRNTLNRIAKGMARYVLNGKPYIVNGGAQSMVILRNNSVGASVAEPVHTISASGAHHALVTAFLTEHANASSARVFNIEQPLRTQCAEVKGGHFAMATAFMEQANGGFYTGDGRSLEQPMSTITMAGSNQRLVTAYMVKYYGNEREGVNIEDPMHTVTTKDRIGLVEVTMSTNVADNAKRVAELLKEFLPDIPGDAEAICIGAYVITDIALRMLAPRELARAQGFPDSYVIERGIDASGNEIKTTRAAQVALIGNSVCPDVAEAIIRANLADLIALYAKVAA